MGADASLAGKLLIAMPGMQDPRFERAVIFICAHSAEGAMGLIINKPVEGVMLADLLEQVQITPRADASQIRVHFGGPVEHGRGFVLHSEDFRSSQATLEVSPTFSMTATLDVLEALAQGTGPRSALLALGYSGWGPGQLENELRANGWLTCSARPELVFGQDPTDTWRLSVSSMGIDPAALSSTGGHA